MVERALLLEFTLVVHRCIPGVIKWEIPGWRSGRISKDG